MKNLSIKQLILIIIGISLAALVVNPCSGVSEHDAGYCELYYPSVNFFCYALFVWYLTVKYAIPALRDRRIQFEISLNKAIGLLRDADHELREAQLSLKHFETDKAEIIERLRHEGSQTAESIVRKAHQTAEAIERDMKRQIEKEHGGAEQDVRHAVVAKAVGRARRTLSEGLSHEDDRRLRQEVIDRLFRGA